MIDNKELLDKAIAAYGSPLYLFNKEEFVRNYNDFVNAMTDAYSKYQLSYSFKTNYTPYICKLIKEMGGYAEVVSDMEYYFAKKVGFDDAKIIYNGPVKGDLGKELLVNDGMLHIDGLDELREVCSFAALHNEKRYGVGLRLNVDIGQNFISRFGIDVDNGDLDAAIKMISETDNLYIRGLHIHVGRSRSAQSWENRAKRVLEVVDKYFKGIRIEYIDLGSGMYGEMDDSLAAQFGTNLPNYSDYAKAVGDVFNSYYDSVSEEDKPFLFTEPGTTISNHYMDFVGTVKAIKHIKEKDFVVMDCSKHMLGETCTLKKLPMKVVHNGENTQEIKNASFVGYTCLEHDVMTENYNGKLALNDYVVWGNVGGYSNVDKPPFIQPNCPMICVEKEKLEVIKRKETFDDILQTYVI